MIQDIHTPIVGFAGFSGSGKTTLLRGVLGLLRERGIKVALIKHAHHTFEMDYPGKDSYELRKSGADTILIASRDRWAMIEEKTKPAEPDIFSLFQRLEKTEKDLILVEGFKEAPIPKIEVYRPGVNENLLCENDSQFIAVVSDIQRPASSGVDIPWMDIENVNQITDFVIGYMSR